LNVKQFRYSTDNLGYLVHGDKEAMAVDGGAAEEILSFVRHQGLTLTLVINTHTHADHTGGNRKLLSASRAEFPDTENLRKKGSVLLEGSPIAVYHTPGHTEDSVTLHLKTEKILLTGDTLFNGTVGNCFSGDLKAFYRTVKHLLSLPADTLVYAGHDYVKDAMTAARRIEPGNPDIDRFLSGYSPDHVFSSLSDERKVNPYLRFNEPTVISFLEKKGLPVGSEIERWESIMAID
jgi:hydroxyacylglutathione hydrolase